MTPIEVARPVAADPSSVALVLAGPAARELWPQQPQRPVAVVNRRRPGLTVAVEPPRRSGVGFTAGLSVRTDDELVAGGRLTIAPDATTGGCDVRLSLTVDDTVAAAVGRDAERYLDRLAAGSRARSSAA